MTFTEAMQELGIEPSTSQEQARRVYLRLLKTRSPEKDPDGFKRLREAWEKCRAWLPSRPEEGPAKPDTRLVAEQDPDLAGAVALAPGLGLAPAPPRAPVFERSPEPEPEPEPEAELPSEPDADEEPEPEPEPEPERPILRTPVQPRDDLRALFARAALVTDPTQWTLVAAAFDAAAANLSAPKPPLPTAISLMPKLVAHGDLHGASSLARSFKAYLTAQQGGALILQGALAARWQLASELVAVAPHLPPPVLGLLSAAVINGDVPAAKPALTQWKDGNSAAAGAARAELVKHAPVINAAIGDALSVTMVAMPAFQPPRYHYAPPQRQSSGTGWAVVFPAILVIIGLSRACSSSSSRYEPPRFDYNQNYTYTPPPPFEIPDYKIPDYKIPTFDPSLTMPTDDHARLRSAALLLCATVDEGSTETCTALRDATYAGDCDEARKQLRALRPKLRTRDEIDAWTAVENAGVTTCLWTPDKKPRKSKAKTRKPAEPPEKTEE